MARKHTRAKAREIASELEMGIDPATILLIIEAITAALQIIKDCRKTQSQRWLSIRANAATPINARRLRVAVRNRVGTHGIKLLGGAEFLDHLMVKTKNSAGAVWEPLLDELDEDDE